MNNRYVLIKEDGQIIDNPTIEGLSVNFQGSGSYVEIHEGSKFVNTKINISNDSRVIIKKTHILGIKGLIIGADGRSKCNYVYIDENFHLSDAGRFVCNGTDNQGIRIGRDNMWSSGIVVRASDGHQLFDLESLETENFADEITFGDNVWIGSEVVVMKGVHIPSGSVVGQSSLVTKKFTEENTVIVGNPARVVKHNVGWSQDYVWDSKEAQEQDRDKKSSILEYYDRNYPYWKVDSSSENLELTRLEADSKDRWVNFFTKKSLKIDQEYYIVLEYISSVSSQFTIFMTNDNQEIYRTPSFWAKKDQRRKIIFPFTPDIKDITKISLSASHFPEGTKIDIFDFRVCKLHKNIK